MGLCLILLAGALWSATFPEPTYDLIAPGVVAASVQSPATAGHPLLFHVVKVDLRQGNLSVRPVKADGKETLAQIVQRLLESKSPLLVAINGDYFERDSTIGIPWGGHVEDGSILFSPTGKSSFLIDPQGRPFIDVPLLKLGIRFGSAGRYYPIAAVNRTSGSGIGSFRLYTPLWGGTVSAPSLGIGITVTGEPVVVGKTNKGKVTDLSLGGIDTPIPADGFVVTHSDRRSKELRKVKPRGTVVIRGELDPPAVQAIGGGPRVVRAGKVRVEFDREEFPSSQAQYLSRRHPRSAVGYNRTRDLLILTVVEGRSDRSAGVTMGQLGQLMIALGAYEAMAFDGGDSATLYVAGKLVVRGRFGGDAVKGRRLANALAVFYTKQGSP